MLFSVQLTNVKPPFGVAVTVCDVPVAKIPAPDTVPSALGAALSVILYVNVTDVPLDKIRLFANAKDAKTARSVAKKMTFTSRPP
jgi:hypothetical protein